MRINVIQFWVLGTLAIIILIDKTPVLIDAVRNTDNYRLYDGWGDSIRDIIYFIAACFILFTMKFKNSKADFMVALLFAFSLLLCIPSTGFYKFLAEVIISVLLTGYIIYLSVKKQTKRH